MLMTHASQSLQHQMTDFKYHYLFTSFDLENFDMEDFRYNFVNITAFRLIDASDIFVKETLKEMQQFGRQHNIKLKRSLAFEVKNRVVFILARSLACLPKKGGAIIKIYEPKSDALIFAPAKAKLSPSG
jgi:hypothetical protein